MAFVIDFTNGLVTCEGLTLITRGHLDAFTLLSSLIICVTVGEDGYEWTPFHLPCHRRLPA